MRFTSRKKYSDLQKSQILLVPQIGTFAQAPVGYLCPSPSVRIYHTENLS